MIPANNSNEYIDRKCKDCGNTFEVRIDKQNTLYGDYCATCFFNNVVEDIYGELRPKKEEEKHKDTSYKDELQGVTHRGKTRI